MIVLSAEATQPTSPTSVLYQSGQVNRICLEGVEDSARAVLSRAWSAANATLVESAQIHMTVRRLPAEQIQDSHLTLPGVSFSVPESVKRLLVNWPYVGIEVGVVLPHSHWVLQFRNGRMVVFFFFKDHIVPKMSLRQFIRSFFHQFVISLKKYHLCIQPVTRESTEPLFKTWDLRLVNVSSPDHLF